MTQSMLAKPISTPTERMRLRPLQAAEISGDHEQRLLASFEQTTDRLRPLLGAAYGSRARWQDGIREALAELLAVFDREPEVASLCVVEALRAGAPTLRRRAEIVDELVGAIDRGRREGVSRASSDLTAEGIVGAVLSVLHRRLLEVPRKPLAEMLAPLMSMIVLPYLGPQAARRELARPPRQPRSSLHPVERGQRVAPSDMRLTYRTLRVLDAIAQSPGASNREIADAAGISDEGQMSKLLGRLNRLQLVLKSDAGNGRAPNSWLLTARGEELLRAYYHRVAQCERRRSV